MCICIKLVTCMFNFMMLIKHFLSLEQINYSDEGLQAIVFTSQGDMRQGLNNLQATFHGFGTITPDNVFKVYRASQLLDEFYTCKYPLIGCWIIW